MITCIILSAGHSSRFGSPKALANLKDMNVIEHLQKTLIESKIDEVIIVLGAHYSKIKQYILKHKKIKVVHNKDFNLGQTFSFKTGIKSMNNADNDFFLLPVDYPFVKKETFQTLIQSFQEDNDLITIPIYHGKKGHPPLFHHCLKKEIMNMNNDWGLNTIARNHSSDIKEINVPDAGILATFNTQHEWENLKKSNYL